MTFGRHGAEIFVPDGVSFEEAMSRSTVMAIGAHPDDMEIMAIPGILKGRQEGGSRFFGVVATNGGNTQRTGDYTGLSLLDMRETRAGEQKASAVSGQYSAVVLLGYESVEMKDIHDSRPDADFMQLIDGVRPDVLYLHNPFDRHDTHVAVCMRAIGALRKIAASSGWMPHAVYGCEVWRSLDWMIHGDLLSLPVDDPTNLSEVLIGHFKSQYAHERRYDLAIQGRRQVNAMHQEAQSPGLHTEIEYAVDLLPLVREEDLRLEDFTRRVLDHFAADILSRVERFSSFGNVI